MLRKVLIAVVIIALGAYAFYLINASPDKAEEVSDAESGFINILEGKEFSAIVYYKNMIYAGGIQGLYKINPQTLQYEELKDEGKSYNTVRAIYPDNDMLWVGHEDGIAVLVDGNIQRTDREDGLTDTRIIDILRVDETTMYASTYSGVAQISGREISYITTKDGLPGIIIKTMLKDSLGWVWMGAYTSRDGGLVCKKDEKVQYFDIENGLVHNCITTIAETPDGRILVGGGVFTEGGANILEYAGGKWEIIKTITKEDGLAGEKVRNIFVDNTGDVWFCSEYDGVAVFKTNGDKIIISEQEGLSNNEVKKVVQDGNNNYWLATKSGITFVARELLKLK